MHRVISMSVVVVVVVVVLIIVVILTNIIRLWRSAQKSCLRMEIPLRVLGFSDLSGLDKFSYNPSSYSRKVEDSIFIYIMSEPVLEKSKSTLSKGTSSAPQTWAEYKERLKVFGWQNGTSYKWYCALI